MNRRTFLLMAPFVGAAVAARISRAEGEPLIVTVPEGECEIECWDVDGNPVLCDDPCPTPGQPYPTPVGYTDSPDELVVVQLPNTGTGEAAFQHGDWFVAPTSMHYWIYSRTGWEVVPFADVTLVGFSEFPDAGLGAGFLEVTNPPGSQFHHTVYFLGRHIPIPNVLLEAFPRGLGGA